ncbi:MAG: tyrosine-type recombinase/integrase [Bacillota bacterium]
MKKNKYNNMLEKYLQKLALEEKSRNTVEKYNRDIRKFLEFIGSERISKESVVEYKKSITVKYKVSSTNSMLVAVNNFLEFCGLSQAKVKLLRVQKKIFASPEKELSKQEYECLITTAEQKSNKQLSLVLQAICSCGLRVSELQFLTISAVHARRMTVTCKNKKRTVLLPNELCKKLIIYSKDQNIQNGAIFKTKNGNPLDRSNIWKMMKNLCKTANVAKTKVFPHNLRHLFARTYYKLEKDIARLADILGHSNINTTRIYTMESGIKHARQINKLDLLPAGKKITT